MLSTLLYRKDNTGSQYTVGEGRSNISIEVNGEKEPKAESADKSFLDRGYSVSVVHQTRLAPPLLHSEGTSGTLKCRTT